jgi:ribonuclease PH
MGPDDGERLRRIHAEHGSVLLAFATRRAAATVSGPRTSSRRFW